MIKDIFVCPTGNMLENWKRAFPKALVTTSLQTVPADEPVLLWVQSNVNDQTWLTQTMAVIAEKFPASKVVVLANTPSQQEALNFMSDGIVGYCHAYSAPRMLKELKGVVQHGGLWLGADLLQALISATKQLVHNTSTGVEQALSQLTEREKQVALQAAEGVSNKAIARALDITERTVKAHMTSILEKLALKDRLQLALVLNEKSSANSAHHNNVATLKGSVVNKPLLSVDEPHLELSA